MVTKEILRCADKSLIAKVDMYEVQCDESMYQKHGIYAFDTGIIEAPLTKEEANLLASRYFYAGWEYVYYCHCTSEFNNMKPATRIVVSEVDVADKLVTEFGEVVFEYNPAEHEKPHMYYKSKTPITLEFEKEAEKKCVNRVQRKSKHNHFSRFFAKQNTNRKKVKTKANVSFSR